jgi:cytochrome c-type biogenesis protein CcmE
MTHLDEELAKALQEAEAADAERADAAFVKPAPTASSTSGGGGGGGAKSKRSIGLLIALLVMGGSILTLVMTSFEGAYNLDVDKLVQDSERLTSRNVIVTGSLVKGTLRKRDQPCEYRFKISKNGAEIPVHYAQCVVPDTFRDVPDMDVDVTATGKLTEAGHFEASHIMAKCPSKYEMKERAKQGEKAPHSATIPASIPAL